MLSLNCSRDWCCPEFLIMIFIPSRKIVTSLGPDPLLPDPLQFVYHLAADTVPENLSEM
jgi:hypothetical protein